MLGRNGVLGRSTQQWGKPRQGRDQQASVGSQHGSGNQVSSTVCEADSGLRDILSASLVGCARGMSSGMWLMRDTRHWYMCTQDTKSKAEP